MAKSKPRPAKKETVDPMEALRAKFNLTPLEEKSKEPDYSNYTGNEGNNKNSRGQSKKRIPCYIQPKLHITLCPLCQRYCGENCLRPATRNMFDISRNRDGILVIWI